MKLEIKFWNSSTVVSTQYDVENKTLTVEFKNESKYEYYNIPLSLWESLEQAESIGKFLNTHVRGAYDYKKIS